MEQRLRPQGWRKWCWGWREEGPQEGSNPLPAHTAGRARASGAAWAGASASMGCTHWLPGARHPCALLVPFASPHAYPVATSSVPVVLDLSFHREESFQGPHAGGWWCGWAVVPPQHSLASITFSPPAAPRLSPSHPRAAPRTHSRSLIQILLGLSPAAGCQGKLSPLPQVQGDQLPPCAEAAEVPGMVIRFSWAVANGKTQHKYFPHHQHCPPQAAAAEAEPCPGGASSLQRHLAQDLQGDTEQEAERARSRVQHRVLLIPVYHLQHLSPMLRVQSHLIGRKQRGR